ncbi:aminotransferase class V-fold PLP-dependent enzyme [Pseudemcibacter aquimaris]|uniref:aminotransferase class V-fold PLP-dependent enzyme n=1 Tax=Pseudemcibacter aquimaris TaxID=2857064 RepID=UPI00201338F1|nr:aminotransferase class V-fold PLP-dependent enzyme [Pseudemcibacter aquimaris]MCC3862017.1 aminotransferase class V-fold PLP-dependent enzyme [Pseudemcibacter aquimaris]WDU58769.1 aminotransferase class V-fold PLP-dependent enzyme [Pseudemcibacter aquimaris]
MDNVIKENKLLDKRRGLLKAVGISTVALMSGNAKAFSQGVDFNNSSTLSDDELFAEVRKQVMLKDDLIYLNTGTLGPAPKVVMDKVFTLMKRLEANPAAENFGPMGREMEKSRAKLAKFLGAQEDEIILTRNTTEGINTVCSGIDWQAGDEILTTNHEHGGAETGLNYLASTKGSVIKKMTMPYPAKSKAELLDLVKSHLTDKTKILLLSHIETVTGLRWPIKDVAEMIKGRDILFIVDGAQAPGMINVDVHELDCDVYACSGHKWIMGPKETGVLYLKKSIQKKINSVFLSGGYKTYTAATGTRNAPNIIGFGDVAEWHMAIGKDRIEKRCMELAAYCYEQLSKLDGIKIITSNDPELGTAIVSFSLPDGVNNGDLVRAMRERNMTIKRLPQYNAIRVSNHMFTTNADVDKMIAILKEYI